jgi:very-short-patch-repair endonuclease
MQTYNPALVPRARAMRAEMTEPERRMWFECLKKMDDRFRRQRPIGRFIVDFYSATLNLVIEIDGESHTTPESIAYDEERTIFLQAQGLSVLRFTNHEVMQNLEGVQQTLLNWVERSNTNPLSRPTL